MSTRATSWHILHNVPNRYWRLRTFSRILLKHISLIGNYVHYNFSFPTITPLSTLKRAHSALFHGGLGGGQSARKFHRNDLVGVLVEGERHVHRGVHHEILVGLREVVELLFLVGGQRGGVLVQQQALRAVGAAALCALPGTLLRADHALVQQLRVGVLHLQRGEDLVLGHSSGFDAHDPVRLQNIGELRKPKKILNFPSSTVHMVHEEDAVLVDVLGKKPRSGVGLASICTPREGGREEYERIVIV